MPERTAIICNKRGLHARAAAKLVTLSERYSASMEVSFNDQSVPAGSIMGLMMLGAAKGAAVSIRGEGPDAPAAIDALVELIESGFNEMD